MKNATLYIVATPIGNLGDMTFRAVETLKEVDIIAAEDTRHSAKLLEHFHIKTPLLAYHDHSDSKRTQYLIEKLLAGESIALISDAGTPLVSDPGYQLVAAAQAAGVRVVPIPGACALIAALAASGLASDRFSFEGFLPAKQVARQKRLVELVGNTGTTIFYEAPHRVVETLQDFVSVLGSSRKLVMARELTKTFETFLVGTVGTVLTQVLGDKNQQRGEIVLLIEGAAKKMAFVDIDPESMRIMSILSGELPPKKAAALTEAITGVKKRELYNFYVESNI